MPSFRESLRYASNGFAYFLKTEKNGKKQAVISVVVIFLGFLLNISRLEWCIILGCIGAVISLEMVNTAIEHVCNYLTKDWHPTIGRIKDVSAGAVWVASIISAITGILIFWPHFKAFIGI